MRIGELSARTNVPARLLRHYEDQGLITPARTPHGHRDYAETDVAQVTRIRALVDAGVPLRLVRRILPHLTTPAPVPLAEADPTLVTELEHYHAVIDARVRCLTRNRDALANFLTELRGGATR